MVKQNIRDHLYEQWSLNTNDLKIDKIITIANMHIKRKLLTKNIYKKKVWYVLYNFKVKSECQ